MKKKVKLKRDAVVIRTAQFIPKEKRESIREYFQVTLGIEPSIEFVNATDEVLIVEAR